MSDATLAPGRRLAQIRQTLGCRNAVSPNWPD
ncbi:Uncharacterised protein [Pantoea agglomerans]|uniref:Uncharacterized protein n=1 Tax=Enterobacter agglomerans TaxID=549 RepID=A0A379ADR1_ENTAG|nr:Uncharacterised protein [Pantoea agglomerans]